MPRSWLRIIGGIVLIFDLLTLAIYRSLNEPEDDDLETDEVHRKLLEVGTQELSHFHNQTLGTVLKAKFQKFLYSSNSYIKINLLRCRDRLESPNGYKIDFVENSFSGSAAFTFVYILKLIN